ncbi:hypothetical protein M9458_037271, partial [Cirrhinus mrigala]
IRQEISSKIQEKPAETVPEEGCGSEPAAEPKPAVGLRSGHAQTLWNCAHCGLESVGTPEI